MCPGIYARPLENRHGNFQEDPRGENIYWIGPSGLPEYDGEGTDFHAVKNGYVAITPIQADLTAHQSIAALQDWLESE